MVKTINANKNSIIAALKSERDEILAALGMRPAYATVLAA